MYRDYWYQHITSIYIYIYIYIYIFIYIYIYYINSLVDHPATVLDFQHCVRVLKTLHSNQSITAVLFLPLRSESITAVLFLPLRSESIVIDQSVAQLQVMLSCSESFSVVVDPRLRIYCPASSMLSSSSPIYHSYSQPISFVSAWSRGHRIRSRTSCFSGLSDFGSRFVKTRNLKIKSNANTSIPYVVCHCWSQDKDQDYKLQRQDQDFDIFSTFHIFIESKKTAAKQNTRKQSKCGT